MKYLTIFILIVISFTTFGQKTEHLLSLTYSNNGQISNTMDQFYFSQRGYSPNNDVLTYTQNDPKLNLHYEYVRKKNFCLSSKIGYSKRKDTYTASNLTDLHGSKQQSYLSIALGAKYIYKADRLEFSAGLEIPYYIISTYKELIFWDSPTQTVHSTETMSGGKVYGLNSSYSGKFFISKRIFLLGEFTIGLLYFDLSGHDSYVIDYQNPIVSGPVPPTILSFKKKAVTDPEFYFGLGIKL